MRRKKALQGCLRSQERLRIQPVVIGHKLAVLEISSEESQIHRPAVAGHSIMLVGFGPTTVVEPHLSYAVILFEVKPNACSSPLVVGGAVYFGSSDGNLYALD